jgi:5'-nucleotidase
MSGEWNRRDFLKTLLAAALIAKGAPRLALANVADETIITILHTNDTHSQIEPFPNGTRNAGLGGVARRATFVKQVRKENANTLMVDGGDMFQGTPYFNFYHGEVEIKAMSAIGYDVVTLGNHDFDEGVENLARMLKYATFQVVSANYDFGNSPLKDIVKPYVIRELAGIRVGLFGMGVDFNGLVITTNHVGVTYRDPIECARATVAKLRNEEKADLVVGLSHLGYRYDNDPARVSDLKVAQMVEDIDFIVGGHTHTFMKAPEIVKHSNGKQTILFQVGYGGINVGRVDFTFKNKKLAGWRATIHREDGEPLSEWHGSVVGDQEV